MLNNIKNIINHQNKTKSMNNYINSLVVIYNIFYDFLFLLIFQLLQ